VKIDGRYLHSGDRNFDHLPNLYILTITNYDPFGYDYMMYTIQNRCREVPDLEYPDGVQLIYFYTCGSKGGCQGIRSMPKYLQTSTSSNATDPATKKCRLRHSRAERGCIYATFTLRASAHP